MQRQSIPELLAPVGGWQQLKAAVQNGADAVYMGGPLFNARIKAENFTWDDMRNAIYYAHERNVKVYITLNTLIKDSELSKAFSYVDFLYKTGADAVILQDMGLARLIKKYLPDMPMHVSTQGTIYNGNASEFIKELGFTRVVPARELSLQEIRELTESFHRGEPCEVEVFVHGALCMCYSGQCQMSRMLGGVNGRSGNRGLCAQPCRLLYKDDMGNGRYLLSPKDICTLEDIPELCRAGVDSLKIEGRLKSPQYVAVVTSIYRKYLDIYRDTGNINVDADDMQKLTQIFNRGGFSKGYLYGNPGAGLLSGESPKNQGIYAGKVKKIKKGSTLVDIETEIPLNIGDGVEIHSKDVTGNVLSYIKRISGRILRIGDIKGTVRPGDRVYKVTDKELIKEAEQSYSGKERIRILLDMEFTAIIDENPTLRVWESGTSNCINIEGILHTELARNKPTSHDRIRQQLSKLGDTPYEAKNIIINVDENAAISIATLNSMRRDAVEKLLQLKRAGTNEILQYGMMEKSGTCGDGLKLSAEDKNIRKVTLAEGLGKHVLRNSLKGKPMLYIYSRKTFETLDAETVASEYSTVCIPLELYMQQHGKSSKMVKLFNELHVEVLPYVLNVSKGALDRYIEENFEDIVKKVTSSGILLGNPAWIKAFQNAGIKVYGDYGLNVYNEQSRKLFEEMGVEVRAFSHEADMFFLGNIPLMITEHPVTSTSIEDRKGEKYTILRWHSGDKYLIFHDKDDSLKDVKVKNLLKIEELQVRYLK